CLIFIVLNSFITDFPQSDLKYEAIKIRNEMAFKDALDKNSIDAFDSFMINYPDAIEFTEAKKIKMNLVFQKAKSINTIEAYNEFVEMYPEGEHYIDIFNLKANALGNKILENNKYKTPAINWAKSFDNKGYDDVAKGFITLPNSDIFIIASSFKQKQKNLDIWFLKLNKEGKMVWNKEIGDTLNESLTAIDLINDNQFIAVGQNNFNDTLKGKSWIISAHSDGSKAWSKNFDSEKLNCVIKSTDKNIVFGGFYEAADSTKKFYLAKIKNSGKIIWQRFYSMAGEIHDVCKTDSNTIMFTGSNFLINVDLNGYIKWEKNFEDSSLINNLEILHNNVCFTERRMDSTFILHKFDLQGNEIWSKVIADSSFDKITDLKLLPNENILMSGIKEYDIQLNWFNNNGERIKAEFFGTDKKETDCKLSLSNENKLLLLITIEYSANDSDILVINKENL
ncbi:MAG: hypothetical protein GXO79_01270, partial [Chlorobi bacterium]|nr:hypothetical protein [Chlorobiota bacterium]